jgi:anti-sigma factor RsiW
MQSRLTCRELIEFLDDYVEQRLGADERARFDDHLGRCPACRRYLSGYQGTLRAVALSYAPEASAPPDVPGELIAAILDSRRAS